MRLSANARSSAMLGVEVVAHHQHVEVLVDRVDGVGHRRVGRRLGRKLASPTHAQDVGRVAAAGALGVEGAQRAALGRGDGVLDEAALVERVAVDRRPACRWHSATVEAAVDRRRRGAPVFVQLQADRAGLDLLAQRLGTAGVALAEESRGSSGSRRRPAACGRMCSGPGVQVVAKVPVAGPGAAAQHRGHARAQRLVDLLRADEVDVAVDAAGGDDHPLAGDDLGARADDDVDARSARRGCRPCRWPRCASRLMPMSALTMPQWSTISALVITQSAASCGPGPLSALALAHAVADGLAAAELHLFAVAAGAAVWSSARPRSPARCRPGERGRRRWGRTSRHKRGASASPCCLAAHAASPPVLLAARRRRRDPPRRVAASARAGPEAANEVSVGAHGHQTFLAQAAKAADRGGHRRSRPVSTVRCCPGSKRTAVPTRCSSACARGRAVEASAPGWSRRSGSASPPGSAGRRCSRPPRVTRAAPGLKRALAGIGEQFAEVSWDLSLPSRPTPAGPRVRGERLRAAGRRSSPHPPAGPARSGHHAPSATKPTCRWRASAAASGRARHVPAPARGERHDQPSGLHAFLLQGQGIGWCTVTSLCHRETWPRPGSRESARATPSITSLRWAPSCPALISCATMLAIAPSIMAVINATASGMVELETASAATLGQQRCGEDQTACPSHEVSGPSAEVLHAVTVAAVAVPAARSQTMPRTLPGPASRRCA